MIDMELRYSLPDRSWSSVLKVQVSEQGDKEENKAYHERVNRELREQFPQLIGTKHIVMLEPGCFKDGYE